MITAHPIIQVRYCYHDDTSINTYRIRDNTRIDTGSIDENTSINTGITTKLVLLPGVLLKSSIVALLYYYFNIGMSFASDEDRRQSMCVNASSDRCSSASTAIIPPTTICYFPCLHVDKPAGQQPHPTDLDEPPDPLGDDGSFSETWGSLL